LRFRLTINSTVRHRHTHTQQKKELIIYIKVNRGDIATIYDDPKVIQWY